MREESDGEYEMGKLKASLLLLGSSSASVDAASFTKMVKIGASEGRGRGLFATKEIEMGEVVMVEKAWCVVWGGEKGALSALTFDGRDEKVRAFPAGLCSAVVQKLVSNPSQ